MRQITKDSIKAFMSAKKFRQGNTQVKIDEYGIAYLYLFNNLIAKRNGNKLEITMAGYNTTTTRERLNGLPCVKIQQKNYTPYLNGQEIDSDEWYEIKL